MTMAERDTPKSSSQEPSGPSKEGSTRASRIETRPSTPPLRGIAASSPKAPLKPRVGATGKTDPPRAVRPTEPPPLAIEVEILPDPPPRVAPAPPGPMTPRRPSMAAPALPRSPTIPPPASSRPRPGLPSGAAPPAVPQPHTTQPSKAPPPAKTQPPKAPPAKPEPPRGSMPPRASLEKAIDSIPAPPPVPATSSGAPPPVPVASSGAPPPLAKAIAALHKKLDEATIPDGTTEEILSAPISSKPSSGLAPGRAPSPMAVVVGSSLRIGIGDGAKPAKSSSPGRPQTPQAAFAAAPAAPGVPPSSSSAHGPRPAYDQAFRRWSQPPASEIEPVPDGNAPVTYQVYTAKDISAGRGPMRSMAVIPDEPQKMSLGTRLGIAAFGVLVALTVAAVVAVSTEDPKPAAPATTSPRRVSTAEPVATPPSPVAPAPTTIAIGDGPEDPPPSAEPPAAATPSHVLVKPKPRPASSSRPPTGAPAAPPPNPYAN